MYTRSVRKRPDAYIHLVLGGLTTESFWEQGLHRNSTSSLPHGIPPLGRRRHYECAIPIAPCNGSTRKLDQLDLLDGSLAQAGSGWLNPVDANFNGACDSLPAVAP